MSTKLQRTVREIERAKAKIAELQAILPELEKQRTDLENTGIINAVRSACVTPGELEAFLASYREALAKRPAPRPAREEQVQSGQPQIGTEAPRDDGE
jgi:hypothetical protein